MDKDTTVINTNQDITKVETTSLDNSTVKDSVEVFSEPKRPKKEKNIKQKAKKAKPVFDKPIAEVSEPSRPNKSKMEQVEDFLSDRYVFRNNDVSNAIEYSEHGSKDWELLNDSDLFCLLQHNNFVFPMQHLGALLTSKFVPRFDPFVDYFENLPPWDGITDYIAELASYVTAKDQERFYLSFKKMLVRTVVCSVTNYINKQAFVLVGQRQNSGKSFFIRYLCPPELSAYISEYFTVDKDGQIALVENFIINLDELAVFSKADLNALKTTMSKDKVKVRLPYAKRATPVLRRVSFFGSTNDLEFLTDHTGSVRWLCFEIDRIDWSYKDKIEINQVWAQAYYLYKNGFKYELTGEEVTENEVRNAQHQKQTLEFELLQRYFEPGTLEAHDEFFNLTDFEESIKQKSSHNHTIYRENLRKAIAQAGFHKIMGRDERRVNPYMGYYVNIIVNSKNSELQQTTTQINDSDPLPF